MHMKICQWIGNHPSIFFFFFFPIQRHIQDFSMRVFPGKAMTVLLEVQLTVLSDLSSNTHN